MLNIFQTGPLVRRYYCIIEYAATFRTMLFSDKLCKARRKTVVSKSTAREFIPEAKAGIGFFNTFGAMHSKAAVSKCSIE